MKDTIKCNFESGICNDQSNVQFRTIPSDIEMFEVNETKLGTTPRLSSRQADLFDSVVQETYTQNLASCNLKLGKSTTRSLPRLAQASAYGNNGISTMLSNSTN